MRIAWAALTWASSAAVRLAYVRPVPKYLAVAASRVAGSLKLARSTPSPGLMTYELLTLVRFSCVRRAPVVSVSRSVKCQSACAKTAPLLFAIVCWPAG